MHQHFLTDGRPGPPHARVFVTGSLLSWVLSCFHSRMHLNLYAPASAGAYINNVRERVFVQYRYAGA
eukprot:6188418-Pleurochrysis_carterae.AAC.3